MALPQEKHNEQRGTHRRAPADNRRTRNTDWRNATDARNYRNQTTSEAYEAAQQERLTGERLLDKDAAEQQKKERREERARKKRVRRISKNSGKLRKIAATQGSVKGSAKLLRRKIKVARATWIAGGLCAGLYYYQVIFWIISISGLGIEASPEIASSLFKDSLGSFASWIAAEMVAFVLPGQSIFIIGWMMTIVIGFMQLLVTGGVYMANTVNLYNGKSLVMLAVVFACTMMPFVGIFPWAYIWMYFVFSSNTKQ